MSTPPNIRYSKARATAVATLGADGVGFGVDPTAVESLQLRFPAVTADGDTAELLADLGVAAFEAVTTQKPSGPAGVYFLAEIAELVADRQLDPRSVDAHVLARIADCVASETSPGLEATPTPEAYAAAAAADLGVSDPAADESSSLLELVKAVVAELAPPPADS